MVAYYEELAGLVGDGKAAANRLSDLVFAALAERKEEIGEFPLETCRRWRSSSRLTGPATKQDRTDLFKHVLDKGVSDAGRHDRARGQLRGR